MLLKDLAHDAQVQEALTKLKKLKKDTFMTTSDMISSLDDAYETLKKVKEVNSNCMKEMRSFKEKLIQEIADRTERLKHDLNEHADKDLRDLLMKHYNLTLSHIPISALNESEDETLNDIYITPDLRLLSKATLKETKTRVTKYKELLVDGDKSYPHIFIQGEAGSGKTTYCAKLVLDWCNPTPQKLNNTESRCKNVDNDFDDVNVLKQFKFVFYVTLRRSLKQNEITRMIREQLIDRIYASDGDRGQAYALLDKILKTEICLIVLDGLDEWADHEGKCALPIMATSHQVCTILVTTRHWKLSEGKINKSQIGKLVELKGVKNPDNVYTHILGRKFSGKQLDEKLLQFKKYARNNKLSKIFTYPLMLGTIVCLWADGLLREGSKCEMYNLILDCLLKKVTDQDKRAKFQPPPCKCLTETQYWRPNIEVIDVLSKVAFHLLFDEQKEHRIIFTDQQLLKYYVSKEHKSFGLNSGILSEMKQSSRSSLFSFIHKTVHEFLAAHYISRNVNVIDTVINTYFNNNDTACGDISQVFVFVCGMNTLAANKMSLLMAEHADTADVPWQFDTYGRIPLQTTRQDIVLDGFQEAHFHQHRDINLQLSHFVFKHGLEHLSETIGNIKKLHDIFTNTNSSIVQELVLDIANCGYANAEYRVEIGALNNSSDDDQETEPLCGMKTARESSKIKRVERRTIHLQFNLSSCHNLKRLYLNRTVTVLPGVLLELKQLKELCILCTYEQLDLSAFPQLEVFHTSHDVTLIPNPLRSHTKLKRIIVTNVEQESRLTHFLLDKADLAQCCSFFPVPVFIESIEMTDIDCSSDLLRSLLESMLKLNRHVSLKIQTNYLGIANNFTTNSGYTMEMGTCHPDWSEAIRGLPIKRLNLEVVENKAECKDFDVVLRNTINSLERLETLRIERKDFQDFLRNIELPSSLQVLILEYHELSPSELCCLLQKLYSLKRTMKCWLKIGYLHKISHYTVTNYREDLVQKGLLEHAEFRVHGDSNLDTTDDDSKDYDEGPTFNMVSWKIKHYISMRLSFHRCLYDEATFPDI